MCTFSTTCCWLAWVQHSIQIFPFINKVWFLFPPPKGSTFPGSPMNALVPAAPTPFPSFPSALLYSTQLLLYACLAAVLICRQELNWMWLNSVWALNLHTELSVYLQRWGQRSCLANCWCWNFYTKSTSF